MKKKALVTGITGQDGAYLADLLLSKGYEVYGAHRQNANMRSENLIALNIQDKINLVPIELLDFSTVNRVITQVKPDEVYNLASQSFVHMSFDQPLYTSDVTAIGTLRLLESIRTASPKTKFYQASSSEMFGKVVESPQNEKTRFNPRSPYAISKIFSHHMTLNYRDSYNMYACSGILFNHESPFRGISFVTRKITNTAARIKYKLQGKLTLGNLNARRDWGFAKEYIEAMWLMLQQEKADDFVIATGKTHTVREFVETAFKHTGIDIEWQGSGVDEKGIDSKTGNVVVEVSPEFFRPAEVDVVTGDPSKAKKLLGWEPKVEFAELVKTMVEADMKLVEKESSNR